MKPNLVLLPNGNYVNPAHVISIELLPRSQSPGETVVRAAHDAGYGNCQLYAAPGDQRAVLAALLNSVQTPAPYPRIAMLPPNGNLARQSLPTLVEPTGLSIAEDSPYAAGVGVHFDWYNDRLQLVIDSPSDDPSLFVQFNQDGGVAAVLTCHEDVHAVVGRECHTPNRWMVERDNH